MRLSTPRPCVLICLEYAPRTEVSFLSVAFRVGLQYGIRSSLFPLKQRNGSWRNPPLTAIETIGAL